MFYINLQCVSMCYKHKKMVWWKQAPGDFKQPVSLSGLLSKHRRRLLALSQRNEALLFPTPQKSLKITQQRSSESQPAQLSIWQFANIRHIRRHHHNSPNVPIRGGNRPLAYRPAYLRQRGDLDPGSLLVSNALSQRCSQWLIKGCRFWRLLHRMIK